MNELIVYDAEDWAEDLQGVTERDFVVPKLVPIQKMSKFVDEFDAKEGDLIDSLTGEKLGDYEKRFECVCFKFQKVWVEHENDEYIGTIPVTPANANMPFEDGSITRTLTYNFYLLPVSVDEPDAYVLSMQKTSGQVARKLLSYFTKLGRINKPPFARVIGFTTAKRKNDKGSWCVPEWTPVRDATEEEMKDAARWRQQFKTSVMKVDEGENSAKSSDVDEDTIPF